jgi:hypothetical protein
VRVVDAEQIEPRLRRVREAAAPAARLRFKLQAMLRSVAEWGLCSHLEAVVEHVPVGAKVSGMQHKSQTLRLEVAARTSSRTDCAGWKNRADNKRTAPETGVTTQSARRCCDMMERWLHTQKWT